MTHPADTTAHSEHQQVPPEPSARLEHFPNAFFAMVMGLAGLTLATERLEKSLAIAHGTSLALLVATCLIFALLLVLYGLKLVRYPSMVAWEWHHPVRMCFFSAASIGLILIGTATEPFAKGPALAVWSIGALLHLGGTLAVLNAWIGHRLFEPQGLTPAWFIPVVGNILVPIVAARNGFVEIGWFFLAVGLVFWSVLLTIVFNRLVFHNPMPGKLLPTLMILIAPPAVGFVAYAGMAGELDAFGRILYYTGVFFFLIILMQVPKLVRIPFALSWWAYSFPLAALTIATLLYAELAQSYLHMIAGIGLFGLVVLVIAGLLFRTGKAIANHQICIPE